MSALFPRDTLAFDRLLRLVGPDPEPIVSGFEAEQRAHADRRETRARRLFARANQSHPAHDVMHDFIWCFGECQKSLLFEALICEWHCGNWADDAFAAFVRASIKAGGHTSSLLDTVAVAELVHILRILPKESLHAAQDLAFADSLPDRVEIHRGGWAESPELLVKRSVSWTTDFAEAEAFLSLNSASRLRGQQPFHLRAEIDFAQILMVFAHESEAIIDPDTILCWEEVGSPIVERYKPLAASLAWPTAEKNRFAAP